MSCLNCFLNDSFQNDLKQSSRKDRFEHTLEAYQDRFLKEFDSLGSASSCSCIPSEIRGDIAPWIDCFLDSARSTGEAWSIFNTLIFAYRCFVDGRPTRSLEQALYVRNIEKRHPKIHDIKLDDLGLMFRGRELKTTDPIDAKFFYHIPFTKRYKVENQRFSLSGFPILYLSRSLLAVRWELNDPKKVIAYAAFGLSPIHLPAQIPKIYDLSNSVHKLINHFFVNFALNKMGIPDCKDLNYQPNIESFPALFHRFIILQMCTFPKDTSRSDSFIEEYLPAQLLTEAIREEGYAGILFPSTRYWANANCNDSLAMRDYPDNVALFTNYDHIKDFDDSLMSLFHIQPLTNAPLKREWKPKEISDQIDDKMASVVRRFPKYLQLAKYVKIIHSQLATVSCDGLPYFESELGQLELEAEFDYLNFLAA